MPYVDDSFNKWIWNDAFGKWNLFWRCISNVCSTDVYDDFKMGKCLLCWVWSTEDNDQREKEKKSTHITRYSSGSHKYLKTVHNNNMTKSVPKEGIFGLKDLLKTNRIHFVHEIDLSVSNG